MDFLQIIVYSIAVVTLSRGHRDLLRFKEYQFTFSLPSRSLIDTESDDTFSCTDMIPSILKKLCLRFTENDNIEYKYESQPNFSAYTNTNDDIISTNDALNWNDINYGQSSSSFSMNNGRNGRKNYQYMKQCRYENGKKECIHYNTPSNTVTFGIKVGANRIPRNSIHNANILPANIYNNHPTENTMDMAQFMSSMPWNPFSTSYNNYDSAHKFEYGDALGYERFGANAMNWKELDCMLCDIISNLNIDNIFKTYGDYTYIFNEHEFDYNIDKDWIWKLDNGKKCTKTIPGIKHKICATETDDNKVLISFEKEQNIRRLLGEIKSEIMDINDELIENLQDEFDGVILDFDDDDLWDDITEIENENKNILFRKCKSFQLAHFCVTYGDNDLLKFHVKVGTHKLKKPILKFEESKINKMINNLWSAASEALYNDYDEYDYGQDLENILDVMKDEYDYDGNQELGDVLEEIEEKIDDDLENINEQEYEEELTDEIMDEIQDDEELDNELEEIVDEMEQENKGEKL